jgi:hypothetical protein
MSNKFKVNDTVEWTSHSQSNSTTKKGTVVAVVPPSTKFPNVEAELSTKYTFVSRYGGGHPRTFESYAVLVSDGKYNMLYWPKPSQLRKAE